MVKRSGRSYGERDYKLLNPVVNEMSGNDEMAVCKCYVFAHSRAVSAFHIIAYVEVTGKKRTVHFSVDTLKFQAFCALLI